MPVTKSDKFSESILDEYASVMNDLAEAAGCVLDASMVDKMKETVWESIKIKVKKMLTDPATQMIALKISVSISGATLDSALAAAKVKFLFILCR